MRNLAVSRLTIESARRSPWPVTALSADDAAAARLSAYDAGSPAGRGISVIGLGLKPNADSYAEKLPSDTRRCELRCS